MSISDTTTEATIETNDDTNSVQCTQCGTPVSDSRTKEEWYIVYAGPVGSHRGESP